MHFEADSLTGELSGYVENSDNEARKTEIDVEQKEDSLFLEIPSMNANYVGKYDADSVGYIGYLRQRGFRMPFKLIKGEDDDILYYRPQKPKRPFPYLEEEVRIENKKDSLVLSGTLTKPKGKGKFPAIILISGSGPEDRDESVFGHKPFLLLADCLTRKGFAVLRCDDRGTAKSTGEYAPATAPDFANDVEVQLDYLRSRKDIDKKKIGLLGHSEGGVIAPMVAVKRKDVSYVVLLAAPGINMFSILELQDSLISLADGESEAAVHKKLAAKRKLFEFMYTLPDSATIADSIDQYLQREKTSDYVIAITLRQLLSPWMRWYVGFEPTDNLIKLNCAVLAINGERDLQVPAEENIRAIERALKAGGNKYYQTNILPGLNHLFQKCTTGNVSEYVNIDETMNPAALDLIGEWLLTVITK